MEILLTMALKYPAGRRGRPPGLARGEEQESGEVEADHEQHGGAAGDELGAAAARPVPGAALDRDGRGLRARDGRERSAGQRAGCERAADAAQAHADGKLAIADGLLEGSMQLFFVRLLEERLECRQRDGREGGIIAEVVGCLLWK